MRQLTRGQLSVVALPDVNHYVTMIYGRTYAGCSSTLDKRRTQHYRCVIVIPSFQPDGTLPVGVHWAEWPEFEVRYGSNPVRVKQLAGLREALRLLKSAGCRTVFVDGSFVTAVAFPGDFDACWDIRGVDSRLLDPVFLDFRNGRAAQKARFLGEFFPAQAPERRSGKVFLDFFQVDKRTGGNKGIVAIDLGRLP